MNPAPKKETSPFCKCLNLACGTSFIADRGWVNVDFSPASTQVRRLNLLSQLPFPDQYFQVIYSSHFLEHVPVEKVQQLLRDWRRLLKPGGKIRLVLPDFQILARRYLELREASHHQEADAVLTLAIDQCVRRYPGGALKDLYHKLAAGGQSASKSILSELDGVDFSYSSNQLSDVKLTHLGIHQRLLRALSPEGIDFRRRKLQMQLALALLPDGFVAQNISFAAVGELHQWLWDEYQLTSQLATAGFVGIERYTASTSGIEGFPCFPLDVTANGSPRKGSQSMVIEAARPE